MKLKSAVLLTILSICVANAKSGEELFEQNCATCHMSIVGLNEQNGEVTYVTEKAPYVADVVEKLKHKTKNKEGFANFIKEYIENPQKRKSLYGKRAIKKFGLMPSLKGVMSDEEKEQLINYLYNEAK